MNPKLEAALCKDFPLLYADRHAPMNTTAMCWGFECGDGWEPIIRAVSGVICGIMDNMTPQEFGETKKPDYRVVQVQEKFGTLRIYMRYETREMGAAISMAEAWSAVTCEGCGMPGTINKSGWLSCRCATCRAKEA